MQHNNTTQNNSTFAVLKNITYRNLWSTTLISNLGGFVQTVAAGWLMTSLTTSHSMVGLVQGATALPVVVFSLLAGALADNFNRKQIMVYSIYFMMIVSIILALLTYLGYLTPFLLLFFTFAISCGTAVYNPPWLATVNDIVNRQDIPAAVTLNSVGYNLMRSIGPALGGGIVALFGSAMAFLFNVLSYIPILLSLNHWKPEYDKNALPRERLVGAMSDGLRYVLMSPYLLNLMVRSFVFGLGAIIILALLPIVAREILHGGALLYGTLLGSFGCGAIFAGLINSYIRHKFRSETTIKVCFIGFAVACLLLAMSSNFIVSHIVLFPAGMCWMVAFSIFNVSVQLSTPRWVVARALALYQTSTYAGMALGSWFWGFLADNYSVQTSIFTCVAFLIFGAVLGRKYMINEVPSVNLEPLDKFREPETLLDLKARSGPIMILIDYQIKEQDLEEFLAVMTLRRRIRIRDGARHWTLMRDLENPDLWTETYHLPTWVEYLRLNQRRTKADADVNDRLEKMSCLQGGTKVHRMIERQTVPLATEMPYKHINH